MEASRMADNEPGAVAYDPAPTRPEDKGVPDLVKDLSRQTATLVRQEMELAKAELSQKGKQAGLGAGMFGGAGLFGLFAFAALTTAAIAALALAVDTWLAALIVAAVYGAIAGVLALTGKQRVQRATPPVEQTADSVQRDMRTIKSHAQAGRS
jgi:uncharacterized membrane protein YqjE